MALGFGVAAVGTLGQAGAKRPEGAELTLVAQQDLEVALQTIAPDQRAQMAEDIAGCKVGLTQMNVGPMPGATASGLLVSMVIPWLFRGEGGDFGGNQRNIILSALAFTPCALGFWASLGMARLVRKGAAQPDDTSALRLLMAPKLRSTGSEKTAQQLLDGLLPVKREIRASRSPPSVRIWCSPARPTLAKPKSRGFWARC